MWDSNLQSPLRRVRCDGGLASCLVLGLQSIEARGNHRRATYEAAGRRSPDHDRAEGRPSAGRRAGEAVVADSERTLILREQGHEPVYYFPSEDVDFSLLEPTEHTTYCPYKGHAGYYSIPSGGERSMNAAWQYRDAFQWVGEISGYLAFYPNRVDRIDD